LGEASRERRLSLIEEGHKDLSVRYQCYLLGVNRSTLYYEAKGTEAHDITLLNEIRDVWARYPFYGYRRITKELQANGYAVNRKRVQRLMVEGGIAAIFPGPNTSRRNKLHKIHPYLLKGLEIGRINQVWQVDITYLRMGHGFVYLAAIIDVYSRYVVGFRISNTLETEFCIEALKSAFIFGIPEIINSDQGCQFTSEKWIDFLRASGAKISMTGKGRCLDNVYIERFWRSVKREEFYLREYANVHELTAAIGSYIEFYNNQRWHQSLNYKTPAEFYFGGSKQ
jgi:putative transposase